MNKNNDFNTALDAVEQVHKDLINKDVDMSCLNIVYQKNDEMIKISIGSPEVSIAGLAMLQQLLINKALTDSTVMDGERISNRYHKEDVLIPFCDLPRGTKFMYPDGSDVWVVIEAQGQGLIAQWKEVNADKSHQSLCSFVDETYKLTTPVKVVK